MNLSVDGIEVILGAFGVHLGARYRAQRRRLAQRLVDAGVDLTDRAMRDLVAEAERRSTMNVAAWLAETLDDADAVRDYLPRLREQQARLDAAPRPSDGDGDSWANQPAYASFEDYQRHMAAAQGITVEQLERERDEAIAAADAARAQRAGGAARRFAGGRVPHPPKRRPPEGREWAKASLEPIAATSTPLDSSERSTDEAAALAGLAEQDALIETLSAAGWKDRVPSFKRASEARAMFHETGLRAEHIPQLVAIATVRGDNPKALLATWLERNTWREVLDEQGRIVKESKPRPREDIPNDPQPIGDIGPIYGEAASPPPTQEPKE